MTPLDYGRSFLIGNGPENEVRFWVESRTRIIEDASGTVADYVQAGACKSERTFAERDLFVEDNYDFLPVFGPEWSMVFRRKASLQAGYKSVLASSELWNGQQYHLVTGTEVGELVTSREVCEATYASTPVVSQTELWNEDTGLRAIIECPVKTMNTHREREIYQVDTGPVVFPDLSQRCERQVDCMALAFVAFNAPDFADFVIEAPTCVGGEGQSVQVYHYSERVSLPARNRLCTVNS